MHYAENRAKALAIGIFCSAGLALTACTTVATYAPDPTLTASTGATLVGSRQENSNPLVKDLRTVVSAVDGKPTGSNIYNWDKPILLAPGNHTVQLYSRWGDGGGSVATQMQFEAGKAYTLRGERQGVRQATVWLEEIGSRQRIGDKLTVCLSPDAPILQLFSACK